MLTEQFIASIGVPSKPPGTNVAKDAAIFIHEFQPLQTQRAVLKKSATPPNCLAISHSHIFAAQAEKAIIHVYSRQHGNQEATVPFTERITSLTLACDDTVLVLGTAEGRLFLWEIASGRQVSTAQSHLDSITQMVVDPTQNFLLSASKDSTVHLWSLPALLSFSSSGLRAPSPISTFTLHRAGVTALAVGHGSSFCNFAVSASEDKTCFIWDYYNNNVLRTYLLPEIPLCLAIDAADRALYAGCEDGSVQKLGLYDASNANTGTSDAAAPIQPSRSSRWSSPNKSIGAARSLTLSFDSCTLLSGHESGQVVAWDAGKGGYGNNVVQNPLPGPVNNVSFLPVFDVPNKRSGQLCVPTVVKPKYGAFDSGLGAVPGSYLLNVELAKTSAGKSAKSAFDAALEAPCFPMSLLDDGLRELFAHRNVPQTNGTASEEESQDFMALEDNHGQPRQLSLEEQNAALKAELEALRRLQTASFEKMDRINSEKKALLEREQKRLRKLPAAGGGAAVVNGTVNDSSSSDD